MDEEFICSGVLPIGRERTMRLNISLPRNISFWADMTIWFSLNESTTWCGVSERVFWAR